MYSKHLRKALKQSGQYSQAEDTEDFEKNYWKIMMMRDEYVLIYMGLHQHLSLNYRPLQNGQDSSN